MLVAQRLGDVPVHDALGEPFDDRRLADPRLADQDGVVLCAPRQHLHHAADLLVPPDHGVDLAFARQLGEVAGEALDRLIFLLGLLVLHTLSPAFWSRGTTMPSSCESRARKRWASLITGLPRERARALACCKASAALTVKRSGLIIVVYGWSQPPGATSVPRKNAVLAERKKDVAQKRSTGATPWCYGSYLTTIFLVTRLPSMTSW